MKKNLFFLSLILLSNVWMVSYQLQASVEDKAFDVLPKAFQLQGTIDQGNFGYAIDTMMNYVKKTFGIVWSADSSKENEDEIEDVVSTEKQEKEIPSANRLDTSLDDWFKKGTTRSAFVLPYYVENEKKYYLLGCETEENKQARTSRSVWGLFGGKAETDPPLQAAAREFVEESGISGKPYKNYVAPMIQEIKSAISKDPTEVFAINTAGKSPHKNHIVFYQFPVDKQRLISGFKNRDGEMQAFGAILAADLKTIMKASFSKTGDARCKIPSTVTIEVLAGNPGKVEYLRPLMIHLRGYLGNEKKGKTFKYFAGGEIVFDTTLQ